MLRIEHIVLQVIKKELMWLNIMDEWLTCPVYPILKWWYSKCKLDQTDDKVYS